MINKCLDCDKLLESSRGRTKKRCEICNKNHRKLYWQKREENPERKKQNKIRVDRFREKNPEKVREYNRNSRFGKNRERYLENKKNSYKRNYENNIQTKLSSILRSRFYMALKENKKIDSAIKLLGCSREDLIKHIESQFVEGMSWDNWSVNGWHIDHIRPVSSFDLSDPLQVEKCFHYTNLQPLWAKDNLSKSNKLY